MTGQNLFLTMSTDWPLSQALFMSIKNRQVYNNMPDHNCASL